MPAYKPLDISFDDKALHDAVRRMQQHIVPNKPRGTSVWDHVLAGILEAERGEFATEGEGKWPRLSPKYQKWKARHGGGRILVFSGVKSGTIAHSLINSLTQKGAAYQKVSMGAEMFRFSTVDPTAHLHQVGRGKRLPARPVVWLGSIYPKVKEALTESAREWEGAWKA